MSKETVPNWDAFQAFMVHNYDTMNPSFCVGKMPCFIIVSHSHFLKEHVDAIKVKIKNNECYMVEYEIDVGEKRLVEKPLVDEVTKQRTQPFSLPLRLNVNSDSNSKKIENKKISVDSALHSEEIDVETEKNKTSEDPHHLLQTYFPDNYKVPTTTCSVTMIP